MNNLGFHISKLDSTLQTELQHKIDAKTKPLGALGLLESLALQIGLIQNTLTPSLQNPHILVFAADHGIAKEGVSAYPQEVTYQMVMNFLAGGAAINVFCKQHHITLKVVDAGVNFDFEPHPDLIPAKIGYGTQNFLQKPAMTLEQYHQAIQKGAEIVTQIQAKGCNIIGFGEMGIGNTSTATALMSLICNIPVERCVGRGTGIDDQKLQHKIDTLNAALHQHSQQNIEEILVNYGGFEIVMMCGVMLKAAELKMMVMVDGFIASSAFLAAYTIEPLVKEYAVFCHQSNEKGHQLLLAFLQANPLLNLQMRLGEGTGCAMAYPIIQSSVIFLNEMASFQSASVSQKTT
jgi:nicotinate-nucleotide--dimethylbenzimidazole phosphoribosyltransferase